MSKQGITKRQREGQRTGFVGLFTNFALFVGKFFAGLLSNSIAIMADSFNNLTDCISSVVTIFGFAHARRKADEGHPYGHGRMEYVAGLVVSIIIIVTGIAVADEVIRRIIDPQPVNSSLLAIVICVAAILIKVGLAIYIRFANRKVESSTLAASGRDSISDAFATTVALTSMVIAPMVNFPIDGYLGIVVTLFILWSGLKSLWENVSLLLGQGLKTEERNAIHDMLRTYKLFDRALELDVHDYGPESRILLAKVHLSNTPHTDEAQRDIEKAKADLETKFGFEQVIIYWSAPQHKAQK